jgi:predicted nucleotidyltransferase
MRLVRLMARRIARRFHPEKIILFGSYATGQARAHSDADLLVVMNCRGSKREKAIEIDVAVSDLGLAKDIIVVTPADARRLKGVPGTITSVALSEGRTLYERPA